MRRSTIALWSTLSVVLMLERFTRPLIAQYEHVSGKNALSVWWLLFQRDLLEERQEELQELKRRLDEESLKDGVAITRLQHELEEIAQDLEELIKFDKDTQHIPNIPALRYKPYQLYALVLAAESDSSAVLVMQKYRDELAKMSGKDCCLIYLRQEGRRTNPNSSAPFEYNSEFDYEQEHAPFVYTLADLLEVSFNELPCLVFFKQLRQPGDQYAIIRLKGLSEDEIIVTLRVVFQHIRTHAHGNITPFAAVQKYSQAQRRSIKARAIQTMVLSILNVVTKTAPTVIEGAKLASGMP